MPLLSYDPMEDGDGASANLWNVRLSAIHDLLNGNLDAANLANGAVTTPKIADGAVTSSKLDIDISVDDNGWTVKDLGSHKVYTKRFTGSPNTAIAHDGNYNILDLALPVGLTNLSTVSIQTTLTANDRCFIIGGWNAPTSTKLQFSISNFVGVTVTLSSYIIDVKLEPL